MKMKKGLFMVVFLLAISSVMAAMSFSSAAVTSDMSVSLVDTQGALLALEASKEHKAASYKRENSGKPMQLAIDLDKGNGDKSYGVQANSVYKWNELFKVTNNSEHAVDVTIKTENKTSSAANVLPHFASIDGNTWADLSPSNTSSGLAFNLAAGQSKWISVKTDTMNGNFLSAGNRSLNLVVGAVKVGSSEKVTE